MAKIEIGGKEVEAKSVHFKILEEHWNEYQLDDGTLVRCRSIVSEIFVTGKKNAQGQPEVMVRAANIVQASEPDTSH